MHGLRHLWSVLFVFTLGCGKITADLNLYSAIALSPNKNLPNNSIIVDDTRTLFPSGGKKPYFFEITSGGGTIDEAGNFTAPSTAGDVTIRIRDSSGFVFNYVLHVKDRLTLTATQPTIAESNTTSVIPHGGIEPYEFSLLSGGGLIDSFGQYTPAGPGTAVIQVRDAAGNSSQSTININAALHITPANSTLWTKQSVTLSGLDGVPPYSYSLILGGGSVLTTTGVYTAPAYATLAHIEVTDILGNTAIAVINVNQGVSISPADITLASGNSHTFSASSGPLPYVFSIASGGGLGSIDPALGTLTTSGAGSLTVRVTDNAGNTSDAQVTVNPALQIIPNSKTLAINNGFTFSNAGGVGPFTYDISSGGGSVDATTGAFTAPHSSGTSVVRVTDSLGNQSTASVTINPALSVSTTTPSITTENTAAFIATGGVAPFIYAVISGPGTIDASTGIYTPPATSGSATIMATDSLGNTATASVSIEDPLVFTADHAIIAANNTVSFAATGGVPPHNFTLDSGPGSINSATKIYTPGASGAAVLRVTDKLGNTRTLNITINPALSISPSTSTIAINKTQVLTASGGVSPYSYTLLTGGGSLVGTTYTAPSTATTATVQVSDSLGNTSSSTITVLAWIVYTISSNTNDFNMYTAMGSPTLAVNYRVIINAGVTVGSGDVSTPAFTTGSGWVAGTQLEIINNGSIIGKGGNGGYGTSWTLVGGPGQNGGPGLQATFATNVINNGTIAGGGGGGGGGGGTSSGGAYCNGGGGGGGGAGVLGSTGGPGVGCNFYPSYAGGNGTLTPGSGAAGGTDGSGLRSGGAGGNGGALGQNGVNGQSAYNYAGDGWGTTGGGPGGLAGSAALGNSNITWSTPGTRLGPLTP